MSAYWLRSYGQYVPVLLQKLAFSLSLTFSVSLSLCLSLSLFLCAYISLSLCAYLSLSLCLLVSLSLCLLVSLHAFMSLSVLFSIASLLWTICTCFTTNLSYFSYSLSHCLLVSLSPCLFVTTSFFLNCLAPFDSMFFLFLLQILATKLDLTVAVENSFNSYNSFLFLVIGIRSYGQYVPVLLVHKL